MKQDEKKDQEQIKEEKVQEEETQNNEPEQKDTTALEQKCVELEERFKRVMADYQNLQKRSQEERSEWIRSGNKELLLRILPILDTLMLAQQHSNDQTLKVVLQQFLDVLKSEGVTKIESVGKVFDPHLMEVVAVDTGDDPSASSGQDMVIEELRAGYLLHDKLLRVAQVKVGQRAEESSKK